MRWLVLVVLVATATPAHADAHGRALYDRYCAPCHGLTGDGLGPAASLTWRAPRAFVRGLYKWRSTPVGQPPLVDDIRATIRFGAPGTSMPAFLGVLRDADIDAVIGVLRDFSPGAFVPPTKRIVLGPPPRPNRERGDELWTKLCKACHGSGNSDGMSAFALSVKPYPYAVEPIHRPREDLADVRRAIAWSVATGIAGTPMQSYAQYLSEADIWAVADHVVEINRDARAPTSGFTAEQIDLDRESPRPVGLWAGAGADELAVFGAPIAPQGPPPPSLAPAQASLAALQCARCHASQMREWEPSRHATAMSPAVRALIAMAPAAERDTCARCHAPLAEQASTGQLRDATAAARAAAATARDTTATARDTTATARAAAATARDTTATATPATTTSATTTVEQASDRLRAEGVSCAGCHVRGWTRFGPQSVSPSLLPIATYPKRGSALFERADFCAACHQRPPREQVAGKPLENTYKEWLDGPYMRRGVQCQQCHMPDRSHAFKGIHDRHTVHEALAVTATATRRAGVVTVVAELRNAGAGHYLPTSPTPALVVAIELLGQNGKRIDGARSTMRIGRDVYFDGSWHERSDTRIAPGGAAIMARAWSGGRTAFAVKAAITVVVEPDAFYERDLADRLARTTDPQIRALLEAGLDVARRSHYVVELRSVPIGL